MKHSIKTVMKHLFEEPLSKTIVNHYKRHDIFKCTHQSHRHFEHKVSVYHVLKEKKCYPQGCLYFNWKCRRLNKGTTCSRKFKHVGKNCFNCKDFYDEKEIYSPSLLINDGEYKEFIRELHQYEDWCDDLRGNEVNYSGTINSVKPLFYKNSDHRDYNLFFDGFLINFEEGYINLDRFNDYVYVKISSSMQQRYSFCKGDKIDFYGRLNETLGRIILNRMNRISIEEKADSEVWTVSKAQLAKKTGTIIPFQHETCLNCDKGSLLDVRSDSQRQRMLYCLEGTRDPRCCSYTISRLLVTDSCRKVQKELQQINR